MRMNQIDKTYSQLGRSANEQGGRSAAAAGTRARRRGLTALGGGRLPEFGPLPLVVVPAGEPGVSALAAE